MKKTRYKFLVVRWLDHHESDSAWDTPGAEPGLAKFESRGWLIFENDDIVELSNTKPLNDAAGENLWGRPLRIGKALIYYRSDQHKPKVKANEQT